MTSRSPSSFIFQFSRTKNHQSNGFHSDQSLVTILSFNGSINVESGRIETAVLQLLRMTRPHLCYVTSCCNPGWDVSGVLCRNTCLTCSDTKVTTTEVKSQFPFPNTPQQYHRLINSICLGSSLFSLTAGSAVDKHYELANYHLVVLLQFYLDSSSGSE